MHAQILRLNRSLASSLGALRAVALILFVVAAAAADSAHVVAGGGAQEEVMANMISQPAGLVTVEHLNLPEEFLRRVADRIIQASYEQEFRAIVAAAAPMATPSTDAQRQATSAVPTQAPLTEADAQPSAPSSPVNWWYVLAGGIAVATVIAAGLSGRGVKPSAP